MGNPFESQAREDEEFVYAIAEHKAARMNVLALPIYRGFEFKDPDPCKKCGATVYVHEDGWCAACDDGKDAAKFLREKRKAATARRAQKEKNAR
jgi:ribosomal protein L37E